MLIDTHTHLNFKTYQDNWQQIVSEAIKADVVKMIVVGTDLESSKTAVSMAKNHPNLFASIGIHPHHAKQYLQIDSNKLNQILFADIQVIQKLALEPNVVAIGEVGLDQHAYKSSKYKQIHTQQEWSQIISLQQKLLHLQVELALKLDLPLIIHSRQLKDQVLNSILESAHHRPLRGVFHCFEGSKNYAQRILDAGFYISFTGNITYSQDRQKVADTVPLNRLLLETDSPFMSPKPHQGQINHPVNVKIIASHHANSRGIGLDVINQHTTSNAQKLFMIK